MDEIIKGRVARFSLMYILISRIPFKFDRQRNKLCVSKITNYTYSSGSIGKFQGSSSTQRRMAHSLSVTVAINQKFVLLVPIFALETSVASRIRQYFAIVLRETSRKCGRSLIHKAAWFRRLQLQAVASRMHRCFTFKLRFDDRRQTSPGVTFDGFISQCFSSFISAVQTRSSERLM